MSLTPDEMAAAPWVANAYRDLGVAEIGGAKDNPRIESMFATVGHPEVMHDETSWCAAAVGTWLTEAGYPIPPMDVNLMGGSYAAYGQRLTSFKPGCLCICYYTKLREKDWRRHICIGIADLGDAIQVIGGNQSNKVSIIKWPKANVAAYRWPVRASAPDLRAAGSTEIALGDTLKKSAAAVVALSSAAATSNEAQLTGPVAGGTPVPVDASGIPDVSGITDHLINYKALLGAANELLAVIHHNPVLSVSMLGAGSLYMAGRKIQAKRVARAMAGHPISTQQDS
jgi:uncharacterized protein (TIGR02594 family)